MTISPQRDWTVLVYSAASADLEKPILDSFAELSGSAKQLDIPVLGQFGHQGMADRFELQKSMQVVESKPADMSRPDSLQDFLRWGMQRYPARHYAVVLGGHGAGFAGVLSDSKRSRLMPLPELREGLGKADLVVFNACLMAQAEVVSELPAGVLVASQTRELGLGLPLGKWLETLQPSDSPADAACKLVEASRTSPERVTRVSALDGTQKAALESGLDTLADEILRHPAEHGAVRELLGRQPSLWERAWEKPLSDEVDLGRLCGELAHCSALSATIREAAHRCGQTLDHVVLASTAPAGEGLSVYAPESAWSDMGPPARTVGKIYAETALAQRTRWDEMLLEITGDSSDGGFPAPSPRRTA